MGLNKEELRTWKKNLACGIQYQYRTVCWQRTHWRSLKRPGYHGNPLSFHESRAGRSNWEDRDRFVLSKAMLVLDLSAFWPTSAIEQNS